MGPIDDLSVQVENVHEGFVLGEPRVVPFERTRSFCFTSLRSYRRRLLSTSPHPSAHTKNAHCISANFFGTVLIRHGVLIFACGGGEFLSNTLVDEMPIEKVPDEEFRLKQDFVFEHAKRCSSKCSSHGHADVSKQLDYVLCTHYYIFAVLEIHKLETFEVR